MYLASSTCRACGSLEEVMVIKSIIVAAIVAIVSTNAIAASADKIQCIPGVDYIVVAADDGSVKHCITPTTSGAAAP